MGQPELTCLRAPRASPWKPPIAPQNAGDTVDDDSLHQGASAPPAPRRRSRRPGFFAVMSCLLLLVVLVGFSRSFYLRPLGPEPPLSGALKLHGITLTLWAGILFVQTALVHARKVRLHRRIGFMGVLVAAAAVLSSAWILALRDAPYLQEAPGRGFGNLMSLVAFALCIGIGAWLRRRPQAHRRLMIMGSIVAVAPALSRIFYQPAGASGPATVVATLSLLASVLVYDLVDRRRPHAATVGALALIFLVAPGITFLLMETGFWPAVLRFAS